MLRRELEILKNLDHPNIIKFYGIYMDDMYIHYVMEFCAVFFKNDLFNLKGGDLYNYISNNGYFKEAEAVKII